MHRVNKVMNSEYIARFLSKCAMVLAGAFLLWCFVISITSSAIIIIDERTLFIKDNVLFTVVELLLVIFIGVCIERNKEAILRRTENIRKKIDIKYVIYAIIIIGIIESIVFVLITRMKPADDQAALIRATEQFRNGNYTEWASGGYFVRWPFQNGLTIVFILLSYVFTNSYALAFQILNCLGIGGTYYLFDKILEKKRVNINIRLMVQVFFLLFFPLRMYVTFMYGTVLGLFLSIAAIYKWEKYKEDGRNIDAVLMCVYASIAGIAKGNYIIFIIGLCIAIVLYAIKQKRIRYILLIGLVWGIYFVFSWSINATMDKVTGGCEEPGMSVLPAFAMGLHENVYRGPGWRDNSHVEKYKAGLNIEGEEQRLAIEDIKNSIREFKSGERDAVDFFVRKEASMWANPAFQGQWVNARNGYSIKTGKLAEWLLSIKTTIRIYPLIDLFLVLIYGGNLIYIIVSLGNKELDDMAVLSYILYIGGVLLYTITEAKTQYTIPYIVLLIPYGAYGLYMCIEFVSMIKKTNSSMTLVCYAETHLKSVKAKVLAAVYVMLGILFVICAWKERGLIKKIFYNNADQATYERYKAYYMNDEKTIEEGVYELKGIDGNSLRILDTDAFTTPVVVNKMTGTDKPDNEGFVVSVENTNGKSMIKVYESDMDDDIRGLKGFVAVDSLDGGMYTEVSSLPYCGFHDFEIIPVEGMNDTYYIKSIDNYAMTMSDDGKVTMEIFDNKDSQKWILMRKY